VGITDAIGATTSYPATIIGKDAMHDLAVLRIEAPQGTLQPLAVGTSADLKVNKHTGVMQTQSHPKTAAAGVRAHHASAPRVCCWGWFLGEPQRCSLKAHPWGCVLISCTAACCLLQVGQFLYALGHPYGLGKSLTVGVVSGLNRTIPAPTGTRIYGAIQVGGS
jgi:S1-C subfamily serine protease